MSTTCIDITEPATDTVVGRSVGHPDVWPAAMTETSLRRIDERLRGSGAVWIHQPDRHIGLYQGGVIASLDSDRVDDGPRTALVAPALLRSDGCELLAEFCASAHDAGTPAAVGIVRGSEIRWRPIRDLDAADALGVAELEADRTRRPVTSAVEAVMGPWARAGSRALNVTAAAISAALWHEWGGRTFTPSEEFAPRPFTCGLWTVTGAAGVEDHAMCSGRSRGGDVLARTLHVAPDSLDQAIYDQLRRDGLTQGVAAWYTRHRHR